MTPLPVNTFFAFPEVCGDYFAALRGKDGWWSIAFAHIEEDGGIPTRSVGFGFEVAYHWISLFNPQFCTQVSQAFGFLAVENADDVEVLGQDPKKALKIGYRAEVVAERRLRVSPAPGAVRPRRFYPLPEFDCYVMLTKDPLTVYSAPMTPMGGLEVHRDGTVPVTRVDSFTVGLAAAVNSLFGTEFVGHG